MMFLCLKETFEGYSQLLGFCLSNHNQNIITGSFDNPGPYGGYLAICLSIQTAQLFKTTNTFIRYLLGVVSLITFVLLPATMSRASLLAFFISLFLIALSEKSSRNYIRKNCVWILISLFFFSICAYLYKRPSADGRFFIDKVSIETIFRNGINGVGVGKYGGSYGSTQHDYFKQQIDSRGKDDLDWSVINEHDRITADSPDNAFNEYLFIGVEYGPLAMLLFIGAIVSAIVISFKRGTIWCYGLTAFAVFAMFSYPLHVWQFQVMLPILLAAAISDGETCKNRKKIAELVMLSITIVVLAFGAWRKIPEIKQYKHAKATWKKTERWHKMEFYEYVVEDCDTLLPYMKHDKHFLFAYGQSLNKIGNYLKSDSILQLGTKISSDPMFWNVMGNNSLAQGKYREAEERYKHAFYMVPNRLYPLYLLAKLYHTEGDTARFLKMAERVETFIPKVESVNTERLRNEIREIRAGYLPQIEQ